jgi:hypothetical protein
MPEVTDPNEPEPLETKRDYPVEGYWRVVGDTVSDVFHGDPDGVRRARERVRKSAPGTQEKFYQTDPFGVAADIAGRTDAGTEDEWRDYLRIRRRHDFGHVEIPDDMNSPYQPKA